MSETPTPTVSQVTVEFGGADGMAATIKQANISPAQWAIAAQLVALMSSSAWAQVLNEATARGIVVPGPGRAPLSIDEAIARAAGTRRV
jgi:hypothetical protein